MNIIEFTLALGAGSVAAGFLGALTGLGGGVVIVPLLVLLFGVDIHYAIGASLVSVIATSSGAAAAYVREGYSNIRAGMFLEIATTIGALSGAMVAAKVPANGLAVVFGGVLLYSAYLAGHRVDHAIADAPPDRWATALHLDSTYPTATGQQAYRVRHVPAGFGLMYLAGVLFWAAGNWVWRCESSGHGSGDAVAIQGVDDHQQLYDRCDGRSQCGRVPASRLHRSRSGDARRTGSVARVHAGRSRVGEGSASPAARRVHLGHRRTRARDALQRPNPKTVSVQFTSRWSDDQLDVVLAKVLRTGVLLSAAIVAGGGVVFLASHGLEQPSYHVFRGEPVSLLSVRGIVNEAVHLRGPGLVQLGLLLLIATPIARVVFSMAGFARQRDWLYVTITAVVLALLSYSLLAGS